MFLLVSACTAQQTPQREVLAPPSVRVNNLRNGEVPIVIQDVKIDVKVVGTLAVTTVDMVFYNGNNRILEGELQFPLSEGQNISGFALDINGKLREGVVVEKAKGQEVFESVIRQNIDPGLLEKTQGNNFRTRVYPLPAKGTRRIVIAYEEELAKVNNKYTVFLPVDYKQTLKTFDIGLYVYGEDVKPEIDETPWGNFSFDKANDAYIASYKVNDFMAQGQLVFSVPEKRKQQVYVEKGKISKENVFYARVNPNAVNQSKKLPSKVALYWDASMSMSDRSLEAEMELLNEYFAEVSDLDVELNIFNCVLATTKSFKVKNGNWDELKKELESTVYDGATQLGILNFGKVKADEIILFSDGLSNFGKNMPLLGNTPVTSISSSLKVDYSLMQYLASATGGKYINLMKQSAKESVKSLLQDSYRLISIEYNDKEIKDVAITNKIIKPSADFSFAGKLLIEEASVVLKFGIGNKILHTQVLSIKGKSKADYDNIVERIWAAKKISELDLMYEKNKSIIEDLGRTYNIVTRNTSLIVLDRIEDYILHKITPPEELLDEYNKAINSVRLEEERSVKQQIESVVSMFSARKQWWNRTFPKTKAYVTKKRRYNGDIPPPPSIDDADIQISVADVQGSDDASAIDIAELREHRVIVEEAPQEMILFTAPVIAADEEVRDEVQQESARLLEDEEVKVKEVRRERPVVTNKIQLAGWNPDTPYLNILKEKSNKELYQAYLDIREEYKISPSFYLDVATLFEERGLKQEALIILSNLAELEAENYRLMRVLAHRLLQLKYADYAINQFEVVLRLRPEEPQSYRDLALANEQNKKYQQAVDLFYKVIEHPWHGRFPGIEVIVAEEMNKVIAKANREKVQLSLSHIDKRLIYNMPVDIRIVLNWDTDNSDMDLWVTDPYGEKCSYQNTLTRIGGLISNDFTQGYGPEEFMIKQAVNGTYKIQANYYGSREQTLIGPTTIYLELFTRFGDGQEKKETITMRLTENKEVLNIGEITFGK